MKRFKQYVGLFTSMFLSFSLLVGYAWWDQLQQRIDSIELEIGYGTRLLLTNLTPSGQGTLVPPSSPLASNQGYTARYELDFVLEFTPDIVAFDLTLEIQNLNVVKEENSTPYSANDSRLQSLIITLSSLDGSIQFFPNDPYTITGSNTLIALDDTRVTTPESLFQMALFLDEDTIDDAAYESLAGATIRFDIVVEVVPRNG